ERCQPTDVAPGVRGEHQADRRDVALREPSAAEHDMNERAPDPAVSVGKGMDGLELCVRDRSLHDRRQISAIHENAEIVHQVLNEIGWWRHEVSAAGIESVSPD